MFKNVTGRPGSPQSSVDEYGGEGTNRTYLDPLYEPTTVLKTAGATRHPSLSFAVIYDLRFAIYEAENEAGELDLPNRKS